MIRRVLVVDDEPNIAAIIKRYLEAGGYAVDLAYSGTDALTQLRQNPPDVLVCDVMMPGMDGFEVLNHVRADPAFASLPLVLMTPRLCLAGEAERHDAKLRAAVPGKEIELLTKPFNSVELINLLRRLDGRSTLESEQAQMNAYKGVVSNPERPHSRFPAWLNRLLNRQ